MGHIIRREIDGDFDVKGFAWTHLPLVGDPANVDLETRGDIKGDAFGTPDTIAFDPRGMLWIGTDIGIGSGRFGQGLNVCLGNNSLL